MLYLAQVQEKDAVGKTKLQLLAYQRSEYAWAVLTEDDNIVQTDTSDFGLGTLVLIRINTLRQVQSIENAQYWVLDIIRQYLSTGVTPEILQQEVQRAEQWRQSLTLQSQELGRRSLEMEARRDQIQNLEEKIEREKQQIELEQKQIELERQELESKAVQLAGLEEKMEREKQQIESDRKELELRAAQLTDLNSKSPAN